jgi:hypothetical protein
MKNSV